MKAGITLITLLFLTGCSATFYQASPSVPTAGLRVATDLGGNTHFRLGDRNSCEESDFKVGLLGWFHPMAGSMQAGRRGTDKRIGLKGSEKYRSNMQAEHYINAEKQPRFNIGNISGFSYTGAGAFSTLQSCDGFFDIDIQAGKNYEIFASKNKNGCTVKAYELAEVKSKIERIEVTVNRVCGE